MWKEDWTGMTIGSALAEAARHFGSRVAMIFENGTLTYEQIQVNSGLVARGFLAKGIRRGDMVGIWMAGYAEWPFIYHGLARIGAIMVPVNTRYKPGELEYVMKKSKAQMLILKDESAGGKDYPGILREVCPELDLSMPGHLESERLPNLREVIVISHERVPGCSSFDELLEAGRSVPEESLAEAEKQVQPDDVVLIQFTSGTTAFPKGAMLFHSAMLRAAYLCSVPIKLSEVDRFFSPQPFFHAGGSIEVMLAPLISGCTMIVQAYFDAAEGLRLMEEHQCTVTMGHQPHFIEYLNHPDLKKRRLCLQKGHIFATPDVNRMVYEGIPIKGLLSPYGQTENHLVGTACTIDDEPEKRLDTVGKVQGGVEIEIRSLDNGRSLPAGEVGEVCFRGWCIMKGYYDDPERTAEAVDENGWLRTGDLGVLDDEGYLRLQGRIKETVRVGGENVAASEVEAFLLQHEKVKQVVVVGLPDLRLGEVCAAFVELKAGCSASEEELISYCRAGLASFKVPRRITFVHEWPMSGTGKIQKYLLRESLLKS